MGSDSSDTYTRSRFTGHGEGGPDEEVEGGGTVNVSLSNTNSIVSGKTR